MVVKLAGIKPGEKVLDVGCGTGSLTLTARGWSRSTGFSNPGGSLFLADFNPPTNPVLAYITTAFVGHGMMQTNLLQLPAMLAEAGFLDISSGGTRSAFLSFVSGRKPAS